MDTNDSARLTSSDLEARSELQEYLHARNERRHLLPKAMVVGLAAGVLAVAYRGALETVDRLRDELVGFSHRLGSYGVILPTIYGALLAVSALFLVKRFAPEASGSGIPHLEGVLRRHRMLRWSIVLPVKFFAGIVASAGGMALGREGPTVQMGGAVGMGLSKLMRTTRSESLILTAAGAGAGLAAAFNAPLSGLVFVVEELQRDFRPTVFGAAFVAAASADVVTRFVAGQSPVFHLPSFPETPLELLPAFLILGIAAGIFGVGFNRCLIGSLNWFSRLKGDRIYMATFVVGAAVGLVAFFGPETVGGGQHLANTALSENGHWSSTGGLLALRFGATISSYGTGVAGGIFTPLLTLGAIFGRGFGDLVGGIASPLVAHPQVFGVVGMGALFTAIVRAPLTGTVLILEMTGSYTQMLPLLIACFAAYATAEACRDMPIYEALLQRDLRRGGGAPVGEEPIILELEVHPGAPFDGVQVKSLGLPSGVVLVQCREGDRETVPDANTRLSAHHRVTAIISPESVGGAEAFRSGCGNA